MPVAAVPRYMPAGQFAKASPALRFGLLLSIWTDRRDQEQEVLARANARSREARQLAQELGSNRENLASVTDRLIREGRLPGLWVKNDHAGRDAWNLVASITRTDSDIMARLASRTQALAGVRGESSVWTAKAKATAPFTTGLGNEHPLENGFSFLSPYGLPYLPGSGVKGVVREAARQLAGGEWENSRGWDMEHVGRFTVRGDGEQKEIPLTAIDVLFGRETPEGESDHFRGVLAFWDVIPEIAGGKLRVEVMTPHQSHYYQQKKERKSGDSVAPHDSGQPNPILFLTVPPESKFHFVVTCDVPRLKRVAPALLEDERWKKLVEAAFEHAFNWLGFGAKTSVGYGAMRRAVEAPQSPGGTAATGASGGQKPATAPAEQTLVWDNATLQWNPGRREVTALAPQNRRAVLASAAADNFLKQLPDEQRKALTEKRRSLSPVKVRVKAEGNKFTILGLA